MTKPIKKTPPLKDNASPNKEKASIVKPGQESTKSGKDEDYKSVEPELTKEDLLVISRKLSSQLEQVRDQLDQFEHTISHTVQEPLRKIITFGRLIQANIGNNPEDVKKFATKIDACSSRLRTVLGDLQDFARVTNYEKLQEKVNLNDILKTTLFDLELLIEEKGAKIVTSELPLIEAIPFQIGQLFYNLIQNALKYSNPDVDPVIEISYRKLTKKELKSHEDLDNKLRFYIFTFKDNGIGFDQQYARQIFTMFQRLGPGTDAGTGMGLAISKKIVQNYYGKIYADGVPGEGATFSVILPYEQPPVSLEDDITILKTWV